MISHLTGTILHKKPLFLVLDVRGVGYKVHATPHLIETVAVGDALALHTHLAVREDALDLFGFPHYEELELFQMLIGVSGIGPRSALGIIGLESIERLVSAIAHGDVGYLTKVSGVGKKSAEKIVLELKDKVALLELSDLSPLRHEEEDVLEALKALGYRADEAREAVRALPGGETTQGERIRGALQILARR